MSRKDKATQFYDRIFKYLFENIDFVIQLIKFSVPKNYQKRWTGGQ